MSSLLAPNIYRFRCKVNATTEIQSELVNERWMLEGLLRGNRLSAWEPISQIIAQLLVRSWDNGWDNRRGSPRDRIALKRRQRNDLVGFELFLRSQTLYPTELRARSETLHCQQFTVNSSSISTSSFSSFWALVRNRWVRLSISYETA